MAIEPNCLRDPLKFGKALWPRVEFYDRQREVVYSVRDNDETFVPAGNMLGKDFVAAFVILWFFLTRHPCRIVTTSAKEDHLRVLWGEVERFVMTAAVPLDRRDGGLLVLKHQDMRKVVAGKECPISYVTGLVANDKSIAAMQGHHVAITGDGVPRTLFVSDESSSVNDQYWTMASTWAARSLVIGNTWPCSNFFYKAVKGDRSTGDPGGDLPRPVYGKDRLKFREGAIADGGKGYLRKVVHVRATDSPNVRLGLAEERMGRGATSRVVVPGVKDWDTYQRNLRMWDRIRQCVSLDAEFYEGAEVRLYPKDWLDRADQLARELGSRKRTARAVGIDPAEGGDRTAMAALDEFGLIELVSRKTPDTDAAYKEAVAFCQRHGMEGQWGRVVWDRGGGGKQHADRMRAAGMGVRTVAFGESLLLEQRRGLTLIEERKENREERYQYPNRRSELYGELRQVIDPGGGGLPGVGMSGVGLVGGPNGFALPLATFHQLRAQMAPVPLLYDDEGRLVIPPKHRKPGQKEQQDKPTLVELVGHSPDELDAVVLALHGMLHKGRVATAGVFR